MISAIGALLAQLVEQLPFKQLVAGSSPARGTNGALINAQLPYENV